MVLVSLWSALRGLFAPSGPPRLVLGGHEVWWPREQLPVNVWVDGNTQHLGTVALATHGLPGGALMFPVELEDFTRNTFFKSRETFRTAIVVQPYMTAATKGGFRTTTDFRYDKRTGEIRNALIEWTLYPGDEVGNVRRLMHEFGHALGLGHCPGTVMQAVVGNWAELPVLWNAAQERYLRGLTK